MYSIKIFLLAPLLGICANSAQSQHAVRHAVVPLHTMAPGQWVEKVWGDPSKPGEPFVLRIHQDAGYITLPHVHSTGESITVVKGRWSLGMGPRYDQAALEPMETGSFGMAPRNASSRRWLYARLRPLQEITESGHLVVEWIPAVYVRRQRPLHEELCAPLGRGDGQVRRLIECRNIRVERTGKHQHRPPQFA